MIFGTMPGYKHINSMPLPKENKTPAINPIHNLQLQGSVNEQGYVRHWWLSFGNLRINGPVSSVILEN